MPGASPIDRLNRSGDLLVLLLVVVALVLGPGRLVAHGAAFAMTAVGAEDRPSLRSAVQAWWGPRELPHRGPDLISVLERRGTLEAANEMTGAVLFRYLLLGGEGSGLVVPEDLGLMSSQVITLTIDRADGSRVVREGNVFGRERLERISPLPITSREYDPALTEEQLEALPTSVVQATFPHGSADVYGGPKNGSGVFVLHTTPERDRILLVPAEYSPLEGAIR